MMCVWKQVISRKRCVCAMFTMCSSPEGSYGPTARARVVVCGSTQQIQDSPNSMFVYRDVVSETTSWNEAHVSALHDVVSKVWTQNVGGGGTTQTPLHAGTTQTPLVDVANTLALADVFTMVKWPHSPMSTQTCLPWVVSAC